MIYKHYWFERFIRRFFPRHYTKKYLKKYPESIWQIKNSKKMDKAVEGKK
jgi:hypothetical protein